LGEMETRLRGGLVGVDSSRFGLAFSMEAMVALFGLVCV
jgi:hypothetical protein